MELIATLFATLLVFIGAMCGLAAGLILGGNVLKGSCRGLDSIAGLKSSCDGCTKNCRESKQNKGEIR